MKVDLEALEATAKAAASISSVVPWWYSDSAFLTEANVSPDDAAHIAANSPDVTLAMIRRILELETAAIDAARTIEGWVTCETQFPDRADDPDWKQAQRIRALVEKGTHTP